MDQKLISGLDLHALPNGTTKHKTFQNLETHVTLLIPSISDKNTQSIWDYDSKYESHISKNTWITNKQLNKQTGERRRHLSLQTSQECIRLLHSHPHHQNGGWLLSSPGGWAGIRTFWQSVDYRKGRILFVVDNPGDCHPNQVMEVSTPCDRSC